MQRLNFVGKIESSLKGIPLPDAECKLMSGSDGESTGQTSAISVHAPLVPERQIINHAGIITSFANSHENSGKAIS